MLPANPPQSEPNIWMQIEKRIAELLDGGPAPTDPEDVRMPEYRALLDALDRFKSARRANQFGGCVMKIAVNLNNTSRVLYVIAGVAIAAVPFVFDMEGWVRVVMPILGVGTVGAGASGW